MSRPPVYLDYHATTPVDRRVLERMLPYFTETFGNPASSTPPVGLEGAGGGGAGAARSGRAHRRVAARDLSSPAAPPNRTTSRCRARAALARRRRAGTSSCRRSSTSPCSKARERLERARLALYRRAVDRDGVIDLEALAQVVGAETALVSVMAANNEIGVLAAAGGDRRDRARAPARCFTWMPRRRPARFRSTSAAMQIDLLSLTGHKMYGPKGCGAIFVRKQTAHRAADRRRRPGARHALGHAQRARHRRAGRGVRDLPRRDGRGKRARWRGCAIGCWPDCTAELDGVIVNGSLERAAAATTCT